MALTDHVSATAAVRLVSEGTCPFCNVELDVRTRAWCDAWRQADPGFARRMGSGLPVDEAGFCGYCESFWFVQTLDGRPMVGSLPNVTVWEPAGLAVWTVT